MALPVAFGWSDADTPLQGAGFTRDISAGGAFINTAEDLQPPAIGTAMWLRMTLPANSLGWKRPSPVEMDARSQRVELEGFAVGFDTTVA